MICKLLKEAIKDEEHAKPFYDNIINQMPDEHINHRIELQKVSNDEEYHLHVVKKMYKDMECE